MPDEGFYDGWDLSRPRLTDRSHLYSLTPIGVRTARVESLTGYISRLAAAHMVETGVLVNHELLPRVPLTKGPQSGQTPVWQPEYSFFLEAHSLNGTGDRARRWTVVLEQLTGVRMLDLLTALPWAKAISCVHLLRTCRAWCSLCYEGQRAAEQSVYDALMWTFQTVTVCAEHRRRLDTVCRRCSRTQYMFSSKTRPGYCSRCQSWLGQEQQGASPGTDLHAEIEAADMVGDLVAAGASLPAGIVLDVFRENLRSFIRDAGGALRFRAAIDHRHIRDWVWRATIPRMDSLLKVARSLNVSVVRLLTERIDGGKRLLQKRALQTPHKVPDSIVEAALQTAIQSGAPPALKDIANHLGYRTPASLQSRDPGLCGQIAKSRQADVRASLPLRTPALPVPRARIQTALIKELNMPGFTDLKAVAASVGLSSKRRLYKDFHELRTAIVVKNAQFRNRQGSPSGESALRAVIDGALREAFDETRAHGGGHSCAPGLRGCAAG